MPNFSVFVIILLFLLCHHDLNPESLFLTTLIHLAQPSELSIPIKFYNDFGKLFYFLFLGSLWKIVGKLLTNK